MNTQAEEQLQGLHRSSGGAIQLLATSEDDGYTRLTVSLDTRGIVSRPGGIKVRNREQFVISVRDSYPFTAPSVHVRHARWAGTAHVQWACVLCIYAAPSVEWDPSDGMRGYIDRLMLWLKRAAEGTLDPDGQPLHPPVAYTTKQAGNLVIHPDLGDRVPWHTAEDTTEAAFVFAWCVQDGERVDVLEWLTFVEVRSRVTADEYQGRDSSGRPYFVAVSAMINGQIGFEYPATAAALIAGLTKQGIDKADLVLGIARASLFNSILKDIAGLGDTEGAFPTVVLIVTPGRRVEGSRLLGHISGWKFDELGGKIADLLGETVFSPTSDVGPKVLKLALDWIGQVGTAWMRVFEDRPEVTHRRDENTSAQFLAGKRVLVLGCGAIGAPIAESCVRAGTTAVTVIDSGKVGPGLLVRQAYNDSDIGSFKAEALAKRLSGIRRDLDVEATVGNAIDAIADYSNIQGYDLVIDATADTGVRAAIERARTDSGEPWPDLVTVLIGHEAERGVVVVSPKGAAAGGTDGLRRTAVRAQSEGLSGWADVLTDFFPTAPRTDLFFPEPGCSSPTFVGAFHEVTALATMMLDAALDELRADKPALAVAAVRLPTTAYTTASVLRWAPDWVMRDQSGKYEIRVSAAAIAEMRAEARRGARVRGRAVETGGMLLGQIDEATGIVSIDTAAGPPPDSFLSAQFFDHGTDGTQAVVDYYRARTAGATGFVGIWHTHPYGRAWPSATDENGMADILSFTDTGSRAFMLILGGRTEEWEGFVDEGTRPGLYAEVVTRSTARRPQLNGIVAPSAGGVFPGGYGWVPPNDDRGSLKGQRR